MKFFADIWPDLDIGQRSENVQIVISPLIFEEILPDWYQRISIPSPIDLSMGYAIWPILARSRDLKFVCQVTLNWETRISPVSLYIQAGFDPAGLESRFHHYFMIWRIYLWPMWPLGHLFSKGCIFQTVTLSIMITITVE